MRKWVTAGVSTVLLTILVTAFSVRFYSQWHEMQVQTTLRTLWAVMRQYANENKEMFYPPCRFEQGVFQPDWIALRNGISDAETLKKLDEILVKGFERPICYTGYLLVSDAYGLPFLANLEKAQSVGMQQDFVLDDPAGLTLRRMREGIWRYFVFDICGLSNHYQSAVPLFWEMPTRNRDVVRTLYMDGHIEYLQYPGGFPVTPLFTERLEWMARSSVPCPALTDIEKLALKVAALYTTHDSESWGLDIHYCDKTPSVSVGAAFGYRVSYGGFNVEDPGFRIVLFPAQTPSSPPLLHDALVRAFDSESLPQKLEETFLGTGMGFSWFGLLQYPEAQTIRDGCMLAGGQDLYPLACTYYRSRQLPGRYHRLQTERTIENPESLKAYARACFCLAEHKMPRCSDIIDAACVLEARNSGSLSPRNGPVPQICRKAEEQLLKPTPDKNVQAVAGVFLTVFDDRGRSGEDIFVDPHGVELLKQMSPDAVRKVLQHLVEHLRPVQYPYQTAPSQNAINNCEAQKAACRELLQQLEQN